MTYYAQVINNEIKRINVTLPTVIGNTSIGLNGSHPELFPITGSAPAYDSATQRLSGPTYSFTGTEVQRVYTVDDIPLADLKAVLIDRINTQRDTLETQGFDYSGKRFQSDERSAARIANAALTAQTVGATFTVDWAAEDNTTLTLDAAGMLGMQAALTQRAATLHYYGRTLKAQVDASTTASELAAIDVTAGWPA